MGIIDRLRSRITRQRYVVTSLWNGQFAATDLTVDDIRQMRRQVEWCVEKGVVPIEGFIHQSEKGAYFVPVSPHCAPVRVEWGMPTGVAGGGHQLGFGYAAPPPSDERSMNDE